MGQSPTEIIFKRVKQQRAEHNTRQMAFERAVSFSSTSLRNLTIFPQNPNFIPKFKLPSSTTLSSKATPRNFNLNLKVRCSNSITNGTYPKPTEIQWNKDLCNSVNLIGFVANPVEIKHLPSGKVVAWTRLSVKKNATQMSWINLTFWDELALVASQHVQQGQQIHVSGRLVTDTVDSVDGKQQTYYKVVAQQLNFIHRSDSPVTSYDQDFNFVASDGGKKVSNAGNYSAGSSVVELWQAFFANPGEWWDNRKNKVMLTIFVK
ncbi:protein OSB2 chloroplastic-like [Trifolium pratense]|uniref:Protein OSB2 chloroplastic-like n=1 Tax=Trifolium pratense TaxID=57577 RepID=A0A2K3P9E5_TRIPR|nr:protein OSB2 chloroplastic-like [Trifolium pratense]